jgi:hypothetical protein
MLKLDNTLLDELGLGGLPEDQKRAMLQHIYETLELRVGTNLANQMTDQQLEEFEKFIDDGGDANQDQALQWLEANLPHYKQVVNEVFEALKLEVREMAPQLMAASTIDQPAPAPAAPAPAYGQPASSMGYQDPMQTAPAQPYTQPAAPAPAQPMAQPYQPQQPAYGAPAPQPAADPMGYQQPAPQATPAPTQDYQAQPPAQQWSQPQYMPPTPPAPQQPAADQPFPSTQPPAGPGSYPPQHPAQ